MRVIARRTIREFWEQPKHRDAEQPLKSWFLEAKKAIWNDPSDVKAMYRNASIIKNNRVIFNIGGNKYRLIAAISYSTHVVFIRFIGTHEEYDKINAEEI